MASDGDASRLILHFPFSIFHLNNLAYANKSFGRNTTTVSKVNGMLMAMHPHGCIVASCIHLGLW